MLKGRGTKLPICKEGICSLGDEPDNITHSMDKVITVVGGCYARQYAGDVR